MEVVHVQLPDERRKVVVFKEPWQNALSELVRLAYNETISFFTPTYNVIKLRVLKNTTGIRNHVRIASGYVTLTLTIS